MRYFSTFFILSLVKVAFMLMLILSSTLKAATQHYCSQAKMIVKSAEAFHINPRVVDDAFSLLVYEEFLNLLDPAGLMFSQEEYIELSKQQGTIDDDINSGDCHFLQNISRLYSEKVQLCLQFLGEYKEQTLHLSRSEAEIERDKHGRVLQKFWKSNWEQWLKEQVMEAYIAADSSEGFPVLDPQAVRIAQQKVVDRIICNLQGRINQNGGLEEYSGSRFLKAVAFAFDPHTEYFTPSEEKEFENMLSTDALSFGFEITTNEYGEMEIFKVIPGSPAWKSNSINEGDVVLAMETSAGKKEDFICRSLQEVNLLIGSMDLQVAVFRIRKKNGNEIELELQKDEVNVEDNVIRSFILDGEKKIGYIYLPAFYTTMNGLGNGDGGCAMDVSKELIKLKSEGIEGLIFDLRNNGGGSVDEAVNLSGLFIDYGAVCIAAGRDKNVTLKDPFRGRIYSDPMVILINGFSASASELFAAAMQDHKRAVLVGSSTFGKSTMQSIIPIDAYKQLNNSSYRPQENSAYIKITGSTFYRVTGNTHQGSGVIPDVVLPDLYKGLVKGESGYATALQMQAIQKKTYYYPSPELPVEELKNRSMERIGTDSSFIQIKNLNQYFLSLENKKALDFQGYWDLYYGKTYSDIFRYEAEETAAFMVENPSYLKGLSSGDNNGTEINTRIMDDIARDPYIGESFEIINDLINLLNL